MKLSLVTPETIKQVAKTMPSSARIFACLQTMLQKPSPNLNEIVDLVRMDAGLASSVVRLSNSVVYRRGEPVESVHDAINRVGLREVNKIVGMTVTGQLFSAALPLYRQQGDMMWQNSLATALAMAQLARNAGEEDRQAYTLGLLRPVGRVALQRMAMTVGAVIAPMPPDTAPAAAVLAWERTHFGLTNAETSAFLLAEWGFASPLCLAVKQHVQPVGAARPSRWAAMLHVASWVADQLGKGLAGEKQFWSQDEAVLREAGLPAKAPDNCMTETREELNRLSSMVRAFGS